MKNKWLILSIFGLVFMIVGAAMASPEATYEIAFYTIDGGGGTSNGGIYEVSGTIGQHDASETLSDGVYNLIGGFWGGGFLDYFVYVPLVIR